MKYNSCEETKSGNYFITISCTKTSSSPLARRGSNSVSSFLAGRFPGRPGWHAHIHHLVGILGIKVGGHPRTLEDEPLTPKHLFVHGCTRFGHRASTGATAHDVYEKTLETIRPAPRKWNSCRSSVKPNKKNKMKQKLFCAFPEDLVLTV